MEEGGLRQDSDTTSARDTLRDRRRRLIESEERLKFFRKMVGWELTVRDIEHFGDDLNSKFRSETMREGRSEKVVIKKIMEMKYKDERRFQHELKGRKEEARKILEGSSVSRNAFKKVISQINGEARRWKKLERSKFQSKIQHIKRLREEAKIKSLRECPPEIKEFANLRIFSKKRFDELKKENVDVSRIGDVKLDSDEISILKLPPKFAIRKKLTETDMQTEVQMGMAKVRYQHHKEDMVRKIDELDETENSENVVKRRKMLDAEEITELEDIEKIEAESRRVFDPINRSFNYGKKRATDLQENSKVTLPRPCDPHTESSIEMLKSSIMKSFVRYQSKYCSENGDQISNLSNAERRGFRKICKRIKNDEIFVLKTDKSGKLTVIKKEEYVRMG